MENDDYKWLFADILAWRQRVEEAGDDDYWPRMASILGVAGQLRLAGWVATNDGALGAVLVGTWVSACARVHVNFAVILKFSAKRVFA